MGISGLIPFLEKASSKVHLRELSGCTVAVDTYCWLHKGVFCCAEKLVRGEDTDQYLQYCLKYVQMLLSYDIKPILVFDGQHLPAKAITEQRRRQSRQQSKKRAAELMRLGNYEEARTHMRRCVDVTHEMALRLIRECRCRNVDCIVAPYEADAQMAWLSNAKLAEYIVTEDSDLVLFGAQNVIFKLDLTGAGLLVQADKLHLAMGCRPEKYNFDKFRRMCILSGCDYLDSLPGIGLAKACKFVMKTEQEDMWIALKKIPQYLNMRQLEVTDEYIENFLKAEATFKHMYVFNPLQRKMERLHALEQFQTEERFCGNAGKPFDSDEQAFQLALGNLNPFTLKQMDNWHPDQTQFTTMTTAHIKRAKHKSIWNVNFQPHIRERSAAKTIDCALYFKKINFISQAIDTEILANNKDDDAKLNEAEIFSIYSHQHEADIMNTRNSQDMMCTKRKRLDSNVTPPESPAIASRHNPFVRAQNDTQGCGLVCENSSLLKVLSPNKSKKVNQETRCVRQMEVRSRLFASNVQRIFDKCTPESAAVADASVADSAKEINQNNARTLSYQTPSPKKKIKMQPENPITSNIDITQSEDVHYMAEATASEMTKTNCDNVDAKNMHETVNLTEDSNDDNESTTVTSKMSLFQCFGSKSALRVGFSKSKPSVNKNTKRVKCGNNVASNKNQLKLSMFGFQKRPSLK